MDLGFFAILFSSAALFVLALLLMGRVRARQKRRREAELPLPVFFRAEPKREPHAGNGRPQAMPSRLAAERFEASEAQPRVAAMGASGRVADITPIPRAASREQDEKTVVFKRYSDGPLQLLPGRLEVVEGDGQGSDIRFMRAWGEPPEVTFGRSRGPAHRHVQLGAPTVSRNHARMELEGERWKIINLSATNPVVLNGEEIPANTARYLGEGDRIELGEVIFRFRER
jgi:hypothetical protein